MHNKSLYTIKTTKQPTSYKGILPDYDHSSQVVMVNIIGNGFNKLSSKFRPSFLHFM